MLRKIILLAGLSLVAGLSAYYISDITRDDIIAANAFARHVEAEPLTAGDIVSLSANGAMSRICDAVVATGGLNERPRSDLYFNRAMQVVVAGARLAEVVGLLEAGSADAIMVRRGLPFIGSESSLTAASYTYANPEDCTCAVARSLSMGVRVCNVSAALVQTSESRLGTDGRLDYQPVARSVAVHLGNYVMNLPEAAFQACGVPFTSAADSVQRRQCSEGQTLPVDVRLRRFLNLIDSEPLPVIDAALN